MLHSRARGEARALVQQALDLGIRMFDTAPVYGLRTSEEILGEFSHHSDMSLSTKVGVDVNGPLPKLDYSYDGMRSSLEGSLSRLRRSAVDVVYIHNPEVPRIRQEATYRFAQWAVEQKLVKRVGISILDPRHYRYISDPALISEVMVESIHAEKHPTAMRKLREKFLLVLRSPLAGGQLLPPELSGRKRDLFIRDRISGLFDRFGPSAMVIGPSRSQQLRAYHDLV
jgi:aryl-alcohol dehydrogenase-like predicted oxidoreductase